MIGATRDNLGKHGWALLGDACVVAIEVTCGEVGAGAEVRGLDRGTILEQEESSVVTLDRASEAGRLVAKGGHRRADGVEGDVCMGVHAT